MKTYIFYGVLWLACWLHPFALCAQAGGEAVDGQVAEIMELKEAFADAAQSMRHATRSEREDAVARLERLYPGFDLDSPKVELLPEESIPGFIDSYFEVYDMMTGQLNRYSYVLFNVKSEKVRNAYVLPFVRESLRKNGYRQEVADICEDLLLCSKTPGTRKEVEALKKQYLRLQEGKPAPEFELEDAEGKRVRLSDFQGKSVFVGIFSSPAEAETMNRFAALPARFGDADRYVFCHVCLGKSDERAAWRKQVAGRGAEKTVYLFCDADNGFVHDYCVGETPRYIFVDESGALVDAWHIAPESAYFDNVFTDKDFRKSFEKLLGGNR